MIKEIVRTITMTTIAIVPQIDESPEKGYRAIAGAVQSEGRTAGQALDALTSKLGEPRETTLVILQPGRPDALFSEEQQRRLEDLMARWRAGRDSGAPLTPDEQTELEGLTEAELQAAKLRAQEVVNGLAK
jgi:hypothetical protein